MVYTIVFMKSNLNQRRKYNVCNKRRPVRSGTVVVNTSTISTTEEQLNELFEDGWQFHSVFTVGIANGGTADYAIVYR